MRKILLLAIAVAACGDVTGPAKSVITATVNGTPFTAADTQPFGLGMLDTLNMSLVLTGSQFVSPLVYQSLSVSLRDFHGVGQYQTCGHLSSMFGIYYQIDQHGTTGSPAYTTDTLCGGEVDILSYAPTSLTISGTFHFNGTSVAAADTVRVTDGKFSGRITLAGLIVDPPASPESLPPTALPARRR
ncbi:MAG TPA: hypothetical protein VEV39_00585 [Gemmatimonadales bacterium]|nr:hypothetical protein [Gemmatimonadales bacterium]